MSDVTAGKIPGVVYSNNDSSPKGSRGEPFCVQIDKIIVDREIRRLKASFENTVSQITQLAASLLHKCTKPAQHGKLYVTTAFAVDVPISFPSLAAYPLMFLHNAFV